MKKKIKLRDLTEEQYFKYMQNLCEQHPCCKDCILRNVNCDSDDCWVCHKDLYSDKFLDQKIEIEVPTFTDKEREYLHNLLKPFKDSIVEIKICKDTLRPDYANLVIRVKSIVEEIIIEEIYLPLFKIGTMYTGLEVGKEYKDDELKELLRELKLSKRGNKDYENN